MSDTRSSVRLGTLAGIPIGIHPMWVLVVGLITWSLGHDYFPSVDPGLSSTAAYALGLLSALGLFAGILLHELGHAVTAQRHGLVVDEIDLWFLGGVSRMHGEPRRAQDELRFAIAGPGVTLVILAVFGVLRLAVGTAGPDWLRGLIEYQLYVSAAILAFNLMPAFPLDGGRVLRAVLWMRSGDQRQATRTAARAGRTFGFVVLGFGVFSFAAGGGVGGLWIAMLGGFVLIAASAEERGSAMHLALHGYTAADLMVVNPDSLAEHLTVEASIDEGFARHLFTSFPVVDTHGVAVGLLTQQQVRRVPLADRAHLRVHEVMARDPELFVTPDTPVEDVISTMSFARTGRAVVVDEFGLPAGLLSLTGIQRRMRADELDLAPAPAGPR